jgi:hypothetical protein
MSTDCTDTDCGSLPRGEQGDPGQPSILAISLTSTGSPVTNNSTSWVEVARFPFSNTIADPFTALKFNTYVDAGVGSFRIKDLVSGNVLYINTNVTSTSVINIETAATAEIYDVTNALIAIEIAHNTSVGVEAIYAGGISFYYA